MSETRICIYSSFCNSASCDMSCVKNIMSQLLMDKSDLSFASNVLDISSSKKQKCWNIIQKSFGKVSTIIHKNSSIEADIYTFSAICKMCVGHGSTVSVYHLKFTKYIQQLRDSWSLGISDRLRETQAFISSSSVLIISGLDYINHKEFECQTLLNIFSDRLKTNKATIVVVNDVNALSGSGPFFIPLKERIKEAVVND